MKEILDRIAPWTALISGTFFVLGILRAMLYYYLPFGIPIHTFIDLSEIFTIWFPDTIFSCFNASLFLLIFWIIKNVRPEHKTNYHYFIIVSHLLHIASIIFIADACYNIFGNYTQGEWEFIRSPYSVIFVISIIFGFVPIAGLVWAIRAIIRPRRKSEFENNKAFALLSSGLFVTYVFVYSIYNPLCTDIGTVKATQVVSLNGEERSIITDDNLRYVGKTRNYIFLWDKTRKMSLIYKVDDFYTISFLSTSNANPPK